MLLLGRGLGSVKYVLVLGCVFVFVFIHCIQVFPNTVRLVLRG